MGIVTGVDDSDLSEADINRMMSDGTPVDVCEQPHQTIEEEEACDDQRVKTLTDTLRQVREQHRQTCIVVRYNFPRPTFSCSMCDLLDDPPRNET